MAIEDSSSTTAADSTANALNSAVSAAVLAQVNTCLMEIAQIASVAKQLSIDSSMAIDIGKADSTLAHSGTVLIEKIGFLADICADKLGCGSLHGGAEDWFLPPNYHWAVNPPVDVKAGE